MIRPLRRAHLVIVISLGILTLVVAVAAILRRA